MQFRSRGTPRFGHRRDQWRIVMMIGALTIVVMTIFRSANPRNWEWVKQFDPPASRATVQENIRVQQIQEDLTRQAVGEKPVHPEAEQDVVSTPEEILQPDAAGLTLPQTLFSTIDEQALFIRPVESDAYWTVMAKVRDTPEETLERAALRDQTYAQIFSRPKAYRGKLITLRGELVQLRKLAKGENDKGIETIYEGWLINSDSGKNPYVFHCLNKPAGLAVGEKLSEQIEVTGYFFKRYQYPAKSGLTYSAPLLLAKTLNWTPPVRSGQVEADPATIPYIVGAVVLIGIAIAGTLSWMMMREQRRSGKAFKQYVAPQTIDFVPPSEKPENSPPADGID